VDYITFLSVAFGLAVTADLYVLLAINIINRQKQEDLIKRIIEG